MRIFIVDDEPDVCKLIKTLVEPLGVEVRICTDSREASAVLEKEKFDGIMLDAKMPNPDGCELARRIRTNPLNQHVPIIMITGQDDVDAMRRAFKAGVTFFIGKPFSREKIHALFRTARGTMLAERRRSVRLPLRVAVNCVRGEDRFVATSLNLGEGGMALENSDSTAVDDVLTVEFSMPDAKKTVKVTGQIRVKEPLGHTAIEFTEPLESGRDAIREYIYGKVTE